MSTQSAEVGKLAESLAKAQGEIQGAIKDSKNPFFNSNYADLASVWGACRVPLSKYGLAVVQTTETNVESGICVVTTLIHSSGQWIRGVLPILAVKRDPQGMGSAITYARRYALAAIAGIAQVDDDGEAAQGRQAPTVRCDEPGPEDGFTPNRGYVIDFGKWNRKTLEQVFRDEGPKVISDYIIYIEKEAAKTGKEVAGRALIFVQEAEQFLGAMENTVKV